MKRPPALLLLAALSAGPVAWRRPTPDLLASRRAPLLGGVGGDDGLGVPAASDEGVGAALDDGGECGLVFG